MIKTTPTTEVILDTADIAAGNNAEIEAFSADQCINTVAPNEMMAIKKEYSIVGDAFYAGINSDVAPTWLTNLITSVVEASVASGLTDYDLLVQDVRNAIASIGVAKNTYVEQINFTGLVDGIIGSHLSTLNATHDGKFATIVDLDVVKVDAESALALRASDLQAEFSSDINSRITSVETAFANADSSLAGSINSLTTVYIDHESRLSGNAEAISGLQTYVGLTGEGYPNGTGMLSRVSLLEKQADGVIEYVTGTYDVMLGVENPNNNTDNDQLIVDALPFVLWTSLSGTGVPVATTRTYTDYSIETPVSAQIALIEGTMYERSDYTDSDVDRYYSFNSGIWSAITLADYLLGVEGIRSAHIGDVYVQYSANVSGVKSYVKSYKFIKTAPDLTSPYATDVDGYGWALIVDTDAQASYVTALNAQDLADSKRRVFVVEPFPPYEEGDLWVDGSISPQVIKVSTSNVLADGSFDDAHWVLADEYAKDFVENIYNPDAAQLHRQLDGKIEYYFYESYTDIASATDEASALSIIDDAWNTQELKDDANGNILYFKDSKNAYWYQGSNNVWQAITDTSIYEALQDAAKAQGAADGKVSQFFAWGGTSAPQTYNVVLRPVEYDTNEYGDFLDINGAITVIPSEYVIIQAEESETIEANNFMYWFLVNALTLKHKVDSVWVDMPTVSGDGSYVSEGDVVTVFDPITNDLTVYSFNGTSWQITGANGIISKSKFFVDLKNSVSGPNGLAKALTNLEITSSAYTDEKTTEVESKFNYDSKLYLGGSYYNSGFGLDSSGVLQTKDGLTPETAFDSEFWVNAESFVLKSPSYPDKQAVFNVTSNGIQLGIEYTEATKNNVRGEFVLGDGYEKGDIVSYLGSSWSALEAVTGVLPTQAAIEWQLFAEKGEAGSKVDFLFTRNIGVPSDPDQATDVWYTGVVNVPAGAGELWSIKETTIADSKVYIDKRIIEDDIVREILLYSYALPIADTLLTPTSSTYNFSSGIMTVNDVNWSQSLPSVLPNMYKILVCTALVTGNRTELSKAITWSIATVFTQRVDGVDGGAGSTGTSGSRGAATLVYSTISSATSSAAIAVYWNSIADAAHAAAIVGDSLILTYDDFVAGWTKIFRYNGSTWNEDTTFTVNGNQIVAGSIVGDAISSQTSIFAGSGSTAAVMSGSDSLYRFWSGALNGADASFTVDKFGSVVSNKSFSCGKPGYNSNLPGFWVGTHDSQYKLYVGDSSKHIKWDGTQLITTGITADSIYATDIIGDVTDVKAKTSTGVSTSGIAAMEILSFTVDPMPFARTVVVSGVMATFDGVFAVQNEEAVRGTFRLNNAVSSVDSVTISSIASYTAGPSTILCRPLVATINSEDAGVFSVHIEKDLGNSMVHSVQKILIQVFKTGSSIH